MATIIMFYDEEVKGDDNVDGSDNDGDQDCGGNKMMV